MFIAAHESERRSASRPQPGRATHDAHPTAGSPLGWRHDEPAANRDLPAELLVFVGASCVVLGGLVAAFTGPLHLTHGSWLAGYLVLVCGVAQYAIGRVPRWLGARAVSAGPAWAKVASWNLGNMAVIGGTLSATPVLVDGGAVLLTAGLTLAWRAVRQIGPATLRGWAGHAATWAYRSTLVGLLVGTGTGVVLDHMRHSGWTG